MRKGQILLCIVASISANVTINRLISKPISIITIYGIGLGYLQEHSNFLVALKTYLLDMIRPFRVTIMPVEFQQETAAYILLIKP